MSQARGRYSGSRDSGQRQPRHVTKALSNRQGQRYLKGAPTRDPSATASIFKTRSFQFLVDAVGAENIALGLDSNLTRVAELMKGERFTPETAFHMETTLGLPHGFFDQSHPVLAPETIARLQSPLDFAQTGVQAEDDPEAFEQSPALQVIQTPVFKDRSPEESEMPKKASGGSPSTAKNRRNVKSEQPGVSASSKGGTAKVETSAKTSRQQSLALNEPAAIQEIRRANLHVLTARNGSKAKLGVLMALTGSNMAHRLHGKKRMDDAEANRFTERLGLPGGWLDTSRSEAEIPESVSRLLEPASRKKTSVSRHQPSTHPDGSPISERVSPDVEPLFVSEDHAGTSSELADGPVRESYASVPAIIEQAPVAPVPQLHATPHPITSTTSLEKLDGIQPIAEALIKTLAGKARTGRLDELKALELLQQAVLL
ncbi:hypothetical protein BTHE68_72260 (plasmid) [Burkholderia sp. THE68]|uniref:hypothetical protein n=1 Tax=Burkholderia sp. THE68 TaxID=758782 RepID=UPI001318A6CC|nr:hypothetical protein [Burkholderia sp. THE68]BBU33492.1 hypothetical protein BTHE68_72260 [Burkholderia sp. THE68]